MVSLIVKMCLSHFTTDKQSVHLGIKSLLGLMTRCVVKLLWV